MREYFKQYFEYSSESPSGLVWITDVHSGKNLSRKIKAAGDTAGYLRYKISGKVDAWVVGLNKKTFSVHRVIYILEKGDISDDFVIDHIDGDPSNNNINNLRAVTRRQNSQNCSLSRRNKSGVIGVSYNTHNDYWQASVLGVNGETLRKCFSCQKYGKQEAKLLAIEAREKMIDDLNKTGMNYTERHGK